MIREVRASAPTLYEHCHENDAIEKEILYLISLVAVLIHIYNSCHRQSCKRSCLQHTFTLLRVATANHMCQAVAQQSTGARGVCLSGAWRTHRCECCSKTLLALNTRGRYDWPAILAMT